MSGSSAAGDDADGHGPQDPLPGRSEAAPTVSDGVPDRCLVLTVRGDWAHFRRVDRTVTKQTYRIPPRTTIAGLLAAIVGVGRDRYYDTFGPEVSAIGIEVLGGSRTVTHPSLGLGTNPDETFETAGGTGRKSIKVSYPDSTDNRQIHSYEYLVDPAYRLYVAVEDEPFYAALKHHLERGTSHYTPSLGLSELLATVEPIEGDEPELEISDVTQEGTLEVDSAVPGAVESVVLEEGNPYRVERVPAFMDADGTGRRTTGFTDYAFVADGSLETTVDGLALGRVDGRVIAFL